MRKSLFFLFIMGVTLFACSQHSVKHLITLPWEGGARQILPMKYWSFEYTTASEKDKDLVVSGVAWPKKETIPGWGRWIKALNLAVYLCDEKGNVLESQRKTYQQQDMPYKTGIPFSFDMHLNHDTSRPLFVTFGYQMEVVAHRNSRASTYHSQLRGDHDEIFFASQGSVLK